MPFLLNYGNCTNVSWKHEVPQIRRRIPYYGSVSKKGNLVDVSLGQSSSIHCDNTQLVLAGICINFRSSLIISRKLKSLKLKQKTLKKNH